MVVALFKAMQMTCLEKLTCGEPVPPLVHPENDFIRDILQDLAKAGAGGQSWLHCGLCHHSSYLGTQLGPAQALRQPWHHLHQLVATALWSSRCWGGTAVGHHDSKEVS